MFHDLLFFALMFGPLLVTSQLAVFGLRSGSYLRQHSRSKMVFLAPGFVLLFPITLFVWIGVLGLFINDPAFFLSRSNVLWQFNLLKMLSAAALLIIGLYWAVIKWYRKKCSLVLDLDQRTYQTIDVASMTLKARTGSWDDIAGIYVKRTYAKGTETFSVRLKWKILSRMVSSLGAFSKSDKAEAFAARISKELELPLVAAPSSWG